MGNMNHRRMTIKKFNKERRREEKKRKKEARRALKRKQRGMVRATVQGPATEKLLS